MSTMLEQGNENFEKIHSMERGHGDMRGLGSNSNVNHTFSSQKTKNVFMKAKGKANAQASHKVKVKVSSQGSSQRSYGVEKGKHFRGKATLNQGEGFGKPKS